MNMIEHLKKERDEHKADAKALVAKASSEQRDLNPVESVEFRAHEEALEQIESRIDEIRELETRRAERNALAERIQPEPTPVGERQQFGGANNVWRTGHEARTYTPDSPHSFFMDLIKSERGDFEARERIDRHRTETRDIGSTALGALVPPQYLPETFAEFLRAGRVTANLATSLQLPPEGMTLNIPRGTTGTVVSAQSGENSSVTEVDFDETTLTVAVRTHAGMQDVSRQSIERGHLVDRVLYADMIAAYNKALDTDVINGPGTTGRHTGIIPSAAYSVTYSTTSTVAAFYAAIADAAHQVASNRFAPPDTVVMHPRRWYWLTSKFDTTGRPLVDVDGSRMNAMGHGGVAGEGAVGVVAGIPCFIDANIPTTVSTSTISGPTEDVVIVGCRSDWLLWEDNGGTPRSFRFDDVGSATLTTRLMVAGNSAFSAGWHPQGTAVVTGSYLTTPSF